MYPNYWDILYFLLKKCKVVESIFLKVAYSKSVAASVRKLTIFQLAKDMGQMSGILIQNWVQV